MTRPKIFKAQFTDLYSNLYRSYQLTLYTRLTDTILTQILFSNFQNKKWIIQGMNNQCLDCDPIKRELFVNPCDADNKNMEWEFGFVNRTALDHFDKIGVRNEI